MIGFVFLFLVDSLVTNIDICVPYQITQCVTIIIASLVAIKKSSNGLPAEPNLPSAVPNTTLNITIPSTFVVAEFTCLKFHRCKGTNF